MIIIRYLVKEALKTQLAILFVLVLIFFCQKLVRVLGAAVDGDVPTDLVLSLLWLGLPQMAEFILPLSLFLGLLMAFSRLYSESEITVMHACGVGKSTLLKAALLLASLTAIIAAANVAWWFPWSSVHQDELIADAKANPSLVAMAQGQFQTSSDGNFVLFVGGIAGNQFDHIFLAQLRPHGNARPSVVVANHGNMSQNAQGLKVVTLDKGTRYEGTALLRDFRITDFANYQAVIGRQMVDISTSRAEQMTLAQLMGAEDNTAKAELHWRLTLIVASLLMALLVPPLSEVNPRQGRLVSMLPAILLYLIFFLLQSALNSNGSKGKLNPAIWMWLVNVGYFLLAIVLNSWNTVPLRRLRQRLRGNH